MTKIIGKISVISTSKIKKIIAIKKNRREKGNRAEFLGSNPHSNGEFFSRSIVVFFDRNVAIVITMIEIIKINKLIKKVYKIIYIKIKFKPYDWKSYILLYYINNYLPHQ